MEDGLFEILRLRPGRYSPEKIDRQYRSIRREILRAGGPQQQKRLDDAFIARSILRLPNHQAAVLRRRRTVNGQTARGSSGQPAATRRAVFASTPLPVCVPASEQPDRGGADACAALARMVPAHLDAGLLRFTARRRLMRLAEGMGITPFKANLIIAEVLHDMQRGVNPPGRLIGGTQPPRIQSAVQSPPLGRTLALAAALAFVLDLGLLIWLFA